LVTVSSLECTSETEVFKLRLTSTSKQFLRLIEYTEIIIINEHKWVVVIELGGVDVEYDVVLTKGTTNHS